MNDEYKSQILCDLIQQIEDNIGDLSMELENNQDIKNPEWELYEKQIGDLYSIIYSLREEIF